MSKIENRFFRLAALSLTAILVVSPALAQTAPRPLPSGTAPQPRIVVIDRNVILQLSLAGKDMIAQANALSQAAEKEFKARQDGLQKEAQALQQQLPILAAGPRAQKQRDFQTKQQAFQAAVQDRDNQIRNGVNKAGRAIDEALGPILTDLLKERGANLLLDRNAVLLATVDVDITAAAIDRLNKKLPKVKVELIKSAPGAPATGSPSIVAKPATP